MESFSCHRDGWLLLCRSLEEILTQSGQKPHFQFDSNLSTLQRPSASLLIGVQAPSGRQGGQHPMGERENKPFQLTFNGSLKVDFQGSRATSDGGLILIPELDERLGLGKLIDHHLSDSRQGTNKKFPLADLLRQSVYSRLAGYEDLNDAVRVSADPTFRLIGSKKNWDRGVALTSQLQSFETGMLASDENLIGLMAVNRELVAQAQDDSDRVVLYMDSTESPVHGQQEGSAYNGHFESVCYHPLLLVQRPRGLTRREAAVGQRAQRRGLGRAAVAQDRASTGRGQTGRLSRRRRLRQARDLRGDGGALRGLRNSYSGQQELGVGDRRHPVPAAGQTELEAP